MLNNLEVSIQLGQFDFGDAKAVDDRSCDLPFSSLSMHDDDLSKLKRRQISTGGGTNVRNGFMRPQTSYEPRKLRTVSRLRSAKAERPKTAPTRLQLSVPERMGEPLSGRVELRSTRPTNRELLFAGGSRESARSVLETPRSYNSFSDLQLPVGKRISVLDKYNLRKNTPGKTAALENISNSPQTSNKYHKCEYIGPHTIHKKLATTTVGPNSTLRSIVGYIKPTVTRYPIHQTAWYHQPNNYTSERPHLNGAAHHLRRQLLVQRSKSSPLKSRFMSNQIDDLFYHNEASNVA